MIGTEIESIHIGTVIDVKDIMKYPFYDTRLGHREYALRLFPETEVDVYYQKM